MSARSDGHLLKMLRQRLKKPWISTTWLETPPYVCQCRCLSLGLIVAVVAAHQVIVLVRGYAQTLLNGPWYVHPVAELGKKCWGGGCKISNFEGQKVKKSHLSLSPKQIFREWSKVGGGGGGGGARARWRENRIFWTNG
jgi:hypothetical protein